MLQTISRLRRLAIILLLAISPPIVAAEEAADQQAAAAAMVVLDEFMRAFNARDMSGWSATLNYPHVRFASGTVTVWPTRADHFPECIRSDAYALAGIGWDHSHWLRREVVLASPEKVHVSTLFQRYNAANEIIGTYQSLYIVTKVDGRWGVQARSSMAP